MNALGFRAADVSPDTELLRGLEPSEVDVILAAARPRRFSAKSVITHQGDPAERLFLLWNGRARYFYEMPNGKKHILIWITPGHIFGGNALALPPFTYLVSTEAVLDSTVLVWDGPAIRDLAGRFPRVMMNAYIAGMGYLSLCWHPCCVNLSDCAGKACPYSFGIRAQHRSKSVWRH
jgi:CRP/FNR family transcriptional regulator, nitrogen oxide reductase regulator